MGIANTTLSDNTQKRPDIECSEFHKKNKKTNDNIIKTFNTEQEEGENNCKMTLEEEEHKKLKLIIIE